MGVSLRGTADVEVSGKTSTAPVFTKEVTTTSASATSAPAKKAKAKK